MGRPGGLGNENPVAPVAPDQTWLLFSCSPGPQGWTVAHPRFIGGLTMSRAKQASKRRGRRKAVTVGVAGIVSLAGGASEAAVGPAGDAPKEKAALVITLSEEEISDVSLATFYVFDNENAGTHHPGLQLSQRTRSRPRQGCGGSAVDCGGGGPTCCASCATGGSGCG
jgi:hypothetical protein